MSSIIVCDKNVMLTVGSAWIVLWSGSLPDNCNCQDKILCFWKHHVHGSATTPQCECVWVSVSVCVCVCVCEWVCVWQHNWHPNHSRWNYNWQHQSLVTITQKYSIEWVRHVQLTHWWKELMYTHTHTHKVYLLHTKSKGLCVEQFLDNTPKCSDKSLWQEKRSAKRDITLVARKALSRHWSLLH